MTIDSSVCMAWSRVQPDVDHGGGDQVRNAR